MASGRSARTDRRASSPEAAATIFWTPWTCKYFWIIPDSVRDGSTSKTLRNERGVPEEAELRPNICWVALPEVARLVSGLKPGKDHCPAGEVGTEGTSPAGAVWLVSGMLVAIASSVCTTSAIVWKRSDGIFGQHPLKGRIESRRHILAAFRQRWNRIQLVLEHDCHQGLALIRGSAKQEKVKRSAQAVDVRPVIDLGRVHGLLRRHIVDRAQNRTCLSDRSRPGGTPGVRRVGRGQDPSP